jgi:ribosomal protein S18 acetylase RimI-like enzyme
MNQPSSDTVNPVESTRYALAYEANAAAYALALAEAGGGLALREADFILALFPYPHSTNGVFSMRFTPENAAERIDSILAIARAQGKKMRFRLGPSSQPADLAQRLVERGVRKSCTQKYMAAPLAAGAPLMSETPEVDLPPGLRVYPLEDYDILYRQTHPTLRAINTPKKRCLLRALQALDESTPRRHWMFVAELEGQLIGSVDLFSHEDSISGYNLVVLKEHRRQGIGSAVLRQMGRFACQQGASLAVLASSVQGTHFYPRLGIAHVGSYPIYMFEP